MKRAKGCLGVFLIFFFGVLVGAAVTHVVIDQKVREIVAGGPDAVVGSVVDRLKTELKLDAAQQEMLQAIAVETRIKLRQIQQQTQPEVAITLAAAEEKVRAILNPDQVKKFNEIVTRGREKWKDSDEAAAAERADPEPSATPSGTSPQKTRLPATVPLEAEPQPQQGNSGAAAED